MIARAHWCRTGMLAAWVVCSWTLAASDAHAQTIAWHEGFDAAVAAAKASSKPILLEVTCAGCSLCKTICEGAGGEVDQTLADERVLRLSHLLECVRVKAEKVGADESAQRFRRFKITMTPAILLLEPDGSSELTRLGWPIAADALAGSMAVVAELGPAQQALKSSANDPNALAALGHVYYQLENHERALEYLRKSLARGEPFDRRADAELDAAICELNVNGERVTTGDEPPRWLRDLEAFAKTQPNNPRRGEALFFLSAACVKAGRGDDAERYLAELIASEPADSHWRELAQQTLSRIQIPTLRAQLIQNPEDAVANYKLGRALMGVSDFDEATKYLSRALAFDPDSARGVKADATLDLAICRCWCDMSGLPRLQHFLRTYSNSPRVPEAMYQLAAWAYSLGNPQEALDTARRLTQTYPQSPFAERAKELAERIEARGEAEAK